MRKAIMALVVSATLMVAILGGFFWSLHQSSHEIMLESDDLANIIRQQRENNRLDYVSGNDASSSHRQEGLNERVADR